MSPRIEREAAMDDMADYAARFAPIVIEPPAHPPVTVLPAHLANAVVPRRNLCAEYSKLPTDKLLVEAEQLLARLDRAGRPTDYAVVVALVRQLARKPALDGALWLDSPAEAA